MSNDLPTIDKLSDSKARLSMSWKFTPLTLNDIKAFIEAHPNGHWLTGDARNCPVAIAYETNGWEVCVLLNNVFTRNLNVILTTHTDDMKQFLNLVDTYSGSINAEECLAIIRQIQEEKQNG